MVTTKPTPKRFYKNVALKMSDDGSQWLVVLDGKPIHTPSRHLFTVKHQALAMAIMKEWDIAPNSPIVIDEMPLTRFMNTAIDKVAVNRDAILTQTLAYGATDLLYYRASEPDDLVQRQSQLWDTVLTWASDVFECEFRTTIGVIPVEQDEQVLEKLAEVLYRLQDDALTAVNILVSITGSLLLGLAIYTQYLSGDEAWDAAFVDELWHIEKWGLDEETDAQMKARRQAFDEALLFLQFLEPITKL